MKLSEMIDFLKVLIEDEIVGHVEKDGNKLSVTLLNGQKFEIITNEITQK